MALKLAERADAAAGDERENAIIDAAHTIFMRYGFQRCTMDDIAREAGMSRPALYQHFRNKKAIYGGLLTRLFEQMVTDIEMGLQKPGPAGKVLRGAYETAVIQPLAALMETPHGCELVDMKGDVDDVPLAELIARKHAVLAAFFRKRMSARSAPAADDLAYLVTDAFEGAKVRCDSIEELREAFGRSVELITAMAEKRGG